MSFYEAKPTLPGLVSVKPLKIVIMKKEMIECLIISALEGGSNYWYFLPDLSMVERREGFCLTEDIVHAVDQGLIIPVHDIETGEPLGFISKHGIKKAVKLMHDNHPRHYADVLYESYDAITADVFFQLVVMGDVVYG